MRAIMSLHRKTLKLWVIVLILGSFWGINRAEAQTTGAALNRPNSVFLDGNYAYVTSEISNALEILDISNPILPAHKGSITHGTDGAMLFQPSSVAVSGNYAYVAVPLGNAIEIVDISDPSNPVHTHTLFHGDVGFDLRRPYFITTSGHYLYVLSATAQYIQILDISDPLAPIQLSGIFPGFLAVPNSLFVSGNYLYYTFFCLCNGGGGLQVVDISNPASPLQIGGISDGTDGTNLLSPGSVFVRDNYAYVTAGGSIYSLEIFDVSDPTNIIYKGSIQDGDGGAKLLAPRDVFVSGNYAYVAVYNGNALEIVDISDPVNPIHAGYFYYPAELSYPNSVEVSGSYAYVTLSLENAFDVIDISNPANPVLASKIKNGELVGTPPPPPVGCTVDCFSNVLFLPGLMGSRLYNSTDNELWVSSFDSDHIELALDNQGKSVDSTIHTKNDTRRLFSNEGNETGIVDEVFGLNTYKSFLEDLRKWKDDDQIIQDYAFIPYDWRLSLEDIITNGSDSIMDISYTTPQNFSDSFILKKLEELQASSRTGKVTIIAHSNGGLVAKALIQKLEDTNNPLYDKIDKIIFVAVPQVGTPDAITTLLHGSNVGPFGLLMSNERSRQLSENMPAVYNLLPSNGYFTTVDPAFAVDKVVSFENIPFFTPQTSQYGVFVSNETELKNYVLGTDGRTKPAFSNTVQPNIGNSNLYTQAENVHQILDSWQPSSNTKVVQVAGWGEETLAGLDYTTKKGTTETISYTPRMVVDGDGTVVVPSALWMSDSAPNVERWWVNLAKFNGNDLLRNFHKNILEVSDLRDFIESEIKDLANFIDSDNIVVSNNSTLISDKGRLHYTLHSPLTLGITDSQGRYTGMAPITKEIREEIPGVNYRQIGEVQFISVPDDIAHTLQLHGYQQGYFALDLEKQNGNTITEFTSFDGIPSSTSTLVTMDFTPNMNIGTSTLKIDQNGDGTVDKTLTATPNGTTTYDITPPELEATFNISSKDVVFSAKDAIDPNPTITTTNTSITLKDSSGNTTIIPFNKLRETSTRLRLTYNKITRNGTTVTVPNTNIVYDWKEKNGVLTDLDTKVTVKGVERNVFNYKKVNNATIIKEKTSSGVTTTTKPGFVVVTVKTEGDSLKVNY